MQTGDGEAHPEHRAEEEEGRAQRGKSLAMQKLLKKEKIELFFRENRIKRYDY